MPRPGSPALAAALAAAFLAGGWSLAGKFRREALTVGPAPAVPVYDDPQAAAVGTGVRDVAVPGPLGPLPAWYFPGPGPAFVIAVHGQNGTRRDLLGVIGSAVRLGFPVLALSYRNDPGAPRDPSGYHRYGQTEWTDLEAAVRWSLARGARTTVLAGQSMGGGIVAAFLRRSPLAARVARVVLEAPMLDLHATAVHAVEGFLTPRVTGRLLPAVRRLPAPLTWTAERIAGARFGVDWRAVDYLRDTGWLQVPALVIHGDADPRVPVSTSVRLKRLQPALVTLERFPGAGHLGCSGSDRPRYTSLVQDFLAPAAR